MPKKLAIDWDDSELRLVAAQCSGSNVNVIDAALVPIQNGDIAETLKQAISDRGLQNTEVLVGIGRGKAELRDLQLPVVPDDELPDMVRFQAIRSFASAGDSATVDYLVTERSSERISMLAAAVGPSTIKEIQDTTSRASLTTKRIALRPLAAAALYLSKNKRSVGDFVLIDLLADDAEIVVARDGKVIFVRTVRMPSAAEARSTALVGELKRSLIACGSQSPDKVVLWGRESVHAQDVVKLSEAIGNKIEVVDPFDLVDTDNGLELPQHVGRLAPLVGLLQSDEIGSDRLIDFLNPRKRVIVEPNPLRKMLLIGVPVAVALLLGFFLYKKLSDMDAKIADLKKANALMKPDVDDAAVFVSRTETVDKFLDGDVNWLNEMRRLATKMPPSDKMIVKTILGNVDQRNGGGTLTVTGGVTNPDVVSEFEAALRDDHHEIVGDGSKQDERAKDRYRWGYNEKISVPSSFVRDLRYTSLLEPVSETEEASNGEADAASTSPDDTADPNPDSGDAMGDADQVEAAEQTKPAAEDESSESNLDEADAATESKPDEEVQA